MTLQLTFKEMRCKLLIEKIIVYKRIPVSDIQLSKLAAFFYQQTGCNPIYLEWRHLLKGFPNEVNSPPSTYIICPLIKSEAREARKIAAPIRSSGVPHLPAGVLLMI